MLTVLHQAGSAELSELLRDAPAASPGLVQQVVDKACRRFPSLVQPERSARIELLIQDRAWTEAALALIELELPQWQLRRIAYDGGEWYCALSRQRDLWAEATPYAALMRSRLRHPRNPIQGSEYCSA